MKKTDEPVFKPRKHPRLWQSYLCWDELKKLRVRHMNRLSAIEAGKSDMDADLEHIFLEITHLNALVDPQTKADRAISVETRLLEEGAKLGDIWTWVTGIRGLGEGGLAVQLLAQIDDIAKFDTVSKLWRFAGYACIDGQREVNKAGEKSHFNRTLKSLMYLVVDSFVKQRTPVYRDLYDAEKVRQRKLHPIALCKECGAECNKKENAAGQTIWRCPENGKHAIMFNDAHVNNRAYRKVAKIFLQHLWIKWREFEGLPTGEPYVQAVLGHTHIVVP